MRRSTICSYCKSLKDAGDYWQRVENYFTGHSDVRFSHGICPDCYEQHVQPQIEEMRRRRERTPGALRSKPHHGAQAGGADEGS